MDSGPGQLTDAAEKLLSELPRFVRTCQREYSVALALSREGLVRLGCRSVLGNGQVRYLVSKGAA